MAFSAILAEGETPPEELDVRATVTFVPGTGITKSELELGGRVPGDSTIAQVPSGERHEDIFKRSLAP